MYWNFKMITFVSDLDQTLIYSKRNVNLDKENIKCVEYIDNKEITYMTKKSFQDFKYLLSSINFIPCTLRDFSQIMRIEFIKNNIPKFMICDNGGRIYINGIEDKKYRQLLQSTLNETVLNKIKENLEIIIDDGYIKYDNQTFITCIFKTEEIAKNQISKIMKQLETPSLFNFELQNRKFYIVPKGLDKSVALQYLIENYKLKNIITSGDGKVDEKFTEFGLPLLPKKAVFSHDNEIRMINDGIIGGEEIVEKLMKITF